jgi:hypothetical protein
VDPRGEHRIDEACGVADEHQPGDEYDSWL